MQDWLKTEQAVNGNRGWIYARVSSKGQEGNGSLEDQITTLRSLARERNIHVLGESREVFFSDDPDRPVLDEVLDLAWRGEFDTLLVDKVDRFSRADPGITGHLVIEFQRRGVHVIFAEVPDDSLEAQIMRAVLSIVARVESVKIKQRTLSGRLRRVRGNPERGTKPQLFIASTPLYGYTWNHPEKGKRSYYIVDPETAAIVIRIYEQVAAGKTLNQIIRELNADHIPTPAEVWVKRGIYPPERMPEHGWQRGILVRILHESKYWGEVYARRTHTTRKKILNRQTGRYTWKVDRVLRDNDDPDIIKMPPELCPVIISPELAAQAHRQLEINQQEAQRNTRKDHREQALLRAGFVSCYNCHRIMIARIYTNKGAQGINQKGTVYGSYVCNPPSSSLDAGGRATCSAGTPNTINITELDTAVWEVAVRRMLDPNFVPEKIEFTAQKVNHQMERLKESREDIERQIAEVERRKKSYFAALGEIDPEDVDGRSITLSLIREQNDRIKSLQRRHEEYSRLLDNKQEQTQALLTMKERLQIWNRRLDEFTYEQRRVLLRALGCHVTVAPKGSNLDGKGSRYIIGFDPNGVVGAVDLVKQLESGLPPEESRDGIGVDSDMQNLWCISQTTWFPRISFTEAEVKALFNQAV